MKLKEIKSLEIMPGLNGRMIHGQTMTWAFWEIEKNASIPKHSHIHEQIMHVVSGKFSFTINDETSIFCEGDTIVITSNSPHCGTAITNCKIMDVFSPKREEYK